MPKAPPAGKPSLLPQKGGVSSRLQPPKSRLPQKAPSNSTKPGPSRIATASVKSSAHNPPRKGFKSKLVKPASQQGPRVQGRATTAAVGTADKPDGQAVTKKLTIRPATTSAGVAGRPIGQAIAKKPTAAAVVPPKKVSADLAVSKVSNSILEPVPANVTICVSTPVFSSSDKESEREVFDTAFTPVGAPWTETAAMSVDLLCFSDPKPVLPSTVGVENSISPFPPAVESQPGVVDPPSPLFTPPGEISLTEEEEGKGVCGKTHTIGRGTHPVGGSKVEVAAVGEEKHSPTPVVNLFTRLVASTPLPK